ncbi:MAG: GNAT family N-acetyltransferase [Clostridia bacterium]|nr:GNAT family N-acetyltransferase [Clostridia bacterium]
MDVRKIIDPGEKRRIARAILEALPDWFGVEESREQYITQSAGWTFFAAFDADQPVGFLCLKETGRATVELAVMGVLKAYHRQGIGRRLAQTALASARQAGYAFCQVKTVQMGRYPDYDDTNRFYRSLGFQEFEVFPTLWDENNPCQVYVMAL